MNINIDTSKTALVRTSEQSFVPSKAKGVKRLMLERQTAENGPVTSVVEYSSGAKFPTHRHPLGEEILVMEGIFEDEFGAYPAGTYLRNPPGSHHTPYSTIGCVLLVKLNMFNQTDRQTVRRNCEFNWSDRHPQRNRYQILHSYEQQSTWVIHLGRGQCVEVNSHEAEELFVISGEVNIDEFCLQKGDWLRIPRLKTGTISSQNGAIFWRKKGHLIPANSGLTHV